MNIFFNKFIQMPKQTRKKHDSSLTHKLPIKSVYSTNDYNSNDGMLTTVWGPSQWHVLHTMSFNYPVNPSISDKHHYRDYVLNLRWVLPCGKCRKNLRNNLKEFPLKMKHMANRETFSKYCYELHEKVNKMLNKTSGLSYEQVKERYEHFRARCAKSIEDMKKDKCRKTAKLRKSEKGCTEPLYGEKAKCILKIVPQSEKCDTFQVDNKCIKRHLE